MCNFFYGWYKTQIVISIYIIAWDIVSTLSNMKLNSFLILAKIELLRNNIAQDMTCFSASHLHIKCLVRTQFVVKAIIMSLDNLLLTNKILWFVSSSETIRQKPFMYIYKWKPLRSPDNTTWQVKQTIYAFGHYMHTKSQWISFWRKE